MAREFGHERGRLAGFGPHVQATAGGVEQQALGHRSVRDRGDRVGGSMGARERQTRSRHLLGVGDLLPQRGHARIAHAEARRTDRVARERLARGQPSGVVLETRDDRERRIAREHGVEPRERAAEHGEHRGLAPRPTRPARRVGESCGVAAPHERESPGGLRGQLEAGLDQHAEGPARAHEETMHRMTRDVLDHASTGACEHAVAGDEACTEDAVAWGAEREPPGSAGVGGEYAAERGAPGFSALERTLLPMRGQCLAQVGEHDPALGGDGEVLGVVDGDAAQRAQVERDVPMLGGGLARQRHATAPRYEAQALGARGAHRVGHLGGGLGSPGARGGDTRHAEARRVGGARGGGQIHGPSASARAA